MKIMPIARAVRFYRIDRFILRIGPRCETVRRAIAQSALRRRGLNYAFYSLSMMSTHVRPFYAPPLRSTNDYIDR